MKADGLDAVLASPDGTRIVVSTRRSCHQHWLRTERRFEPRRPKARSRITILDSRTLKPVATLELGWGRQMVNFRYYGGSGRWVWNEDSFIFGQAGRLYALFPGYRSDKPGETLPAEIIAIDLNAGQVIARREFNKPVDTLLPAAGKDRSVVVFDTPAIDNSYTVVSHQYDLSWVDLDKLNVLGTVRVRATQAPIPGSGR